VKFHITDDLPDLGSAVSREEILILMAVAHRLSPIFADAIETASEPVRGEVLANASRSVRSREHATAG
jgi:hypothetical protein